MNDLPNKEHDDVVSKIYRASAQDNPPQALDDALLAMAKKHNHVRHTKTLPWWKKMQYQGAIAACITIVCVVYIMRPQPLQMEMNDSLAANNLVQESPSVESLSRAYTSDDSSALQSSPAARSRKMTQSEMEQTNASQRNVREAEMAEFSSIHSEGAAIVKSQLVQGLLAENDEIVTVLLELKSTLELNHPQIMMRISQDKSGELDPLLNRYRKQRESLITNLRELFKVLPNFELPPAYKDFVSEKEIKALKIEKQNNIKSN